MTEELSEIERTAGALLADLSPARRRSLLRRMARDLAKRQRMRILSQHEPDGSPFPPRRKKVPPRQGKYAVSFLYPSAGSGPARRVILKSYAIEHGMMTGFDIEAEGIRSFLYGKVIKWLPVPVEYRNVSMSRKRTPLRRKVMFRRLASGRYLKSGADAGAFWVGFAGKAAEIARIHQEGLRDKPSAKAKAITYPRRVLLGWAEEDKAFLLETLLNALTGSVNGDAS